MSTQLDPKTTNSGTTYKRNSDQLVSIQLLGTIFAIVFSFFGVQWQISTLVSNITEQLTQSKSEIQALKEDIGELKASIKELTHYPQK